jgi:N6-adenosine-specific RNA methylase IME4
MTDAAICELPIADLAADDCVLLMWAVGPKLNVAFDVITAWGFTYKTIGFTWAKSNADEESDFAGMGYWTRANAELCLLATRGKPRRVGTDVNQLVRAPRGVHSAKPDEVAERIERLVDGPYIELFRRGPARDGWDAWGTEAEGGT